MPEVETTNLNSVECMYVRIYVCTYVRRHACMYTCKLRLTRLSVHNLTTTSPIVMQFFLSDSPPLREGFKPYSIMPINLFRESNYYDSSPRRAVVSSQPVLFFGTASHAIRARILQIFTQKLKLCKFPTPCMSRNAAPPDGF